MRTAFVGFVALAWTVGLALPAGAQAKGAHQQPPDPAAARREARAAQAAFERLRFRHLPWTSDAGGGGDCDERVGRFCLTYGDPGEDDDWTPPPEHPDVSAGRLRLVDRLGAAAGVAPEDGWIAGQRVRYLAEAGRAADAVAAARACRAEGWWCHALEGYAHHAAGAFPAAEAAFDSALETMPAPERERWTSLAVLLDYDEARALRRLAAPARDSAVRRLWWLADPLWMQPGNDRLTEHHARLVADDLQERARTPDAAIWGSDLREILLRWGEPVAWERIRQRPGAIGLPPIHTRYAPRAWEFLPPVAAAHGPAALEEDDWRMLARGTRTSYGPDSVRAFRPLDHQLAVFRRNDRAVVVAAFRMDSLPERPDVDAALVSSPGPDAAPEIASARLAASAGVLRAELPPEATIVSVEARERATARVGRARYAVDLRPAAGALRLSDVLLLADPEARPTALDAAVAGARASTRVRAGERLALFWEVYGAEGRTDTLTVTVALSRAPVSATRRAAERLRLARGVPPLRVRFTAESTGEAAVPRALGITVPPGLPPGLYALELTVQSRAGTATTARALTLER